MSCESKITDGLLFDCQNMPKGGLAGSRGVIINYDDIDWTATTNTGAVYSALVLKAGTTGYEVEWYKKLGSAGTDFEGSADNISGFKNSFLSRLANTSADNAERAFEMASGKFVMVVETVYKGENNEDAFKIYGIDTGMELTEMAGSSDENSGSLLYTLATGEDDVEKYPYTILRETDYDTTLASFEALFEEV